MDVTATYPQRVVRMQPGASTNVRNTVFNVVYQVNSAAGMQLLVFGPDLAGIPSAHEILIRTPQVTFCGNVAGCFTGGSNLLAGQRITSPSTVDVRASDVAAGLMLPILLHEMGHAIGLDHYDALYAGQRQMMASDITSDMTTYRQGDRNGIRDLVESYNTPFGSFDASAQNGPRTVRVQGWAVDSNSPQAAVDLHVYVDGRFAGAGRTSIPRPDVSKAFYGVNQNSGYDFTLTHIPSGRRNVCVCHQYRVRNCKPTFGMSYDNRWG